MRYKLQLLTIASLSVLFFTQCKKEKNEDPTTSPTTPSSPSGPSNLTELFAQNGAQVQTLHIDAATSQTITVDGAKVNIPAGAFVTMSGGAVTGTVDVIVKGVFTKKDIILSGAPANAQSKLVSTKGCIKVSASQNSQTMRVNPATNTYVDIPEPGTTPLGTIKKFYAASISVTDSSKIWRASSDTAAVTAVFNSSDQKYYYHAKLDSAAWLNAGYLWDTVAAKTTVTVNLGSSFDGTSAAVYISLNGSITVGALYHQGNGVYKISNIPVGKNVVLLALGIKSGTYYYASAATTITNGHIQNLTPQSTTLGDIQTQLSALP
jgi:hypothetical protein